MLLKAVGRGAVVYRLDRTLTEKGRNQGCASQGGTLLPGAFHSLNRAVDTGEDTTDTPLKVAKHGAIVNHIDRTVAVRKRRWLCPVRIDTVIHSATAGVSDSEH
jgi:hypothetical protein